MKFLQYDFNLNTGDVVEVTLDKQANVQLMDDSNFSNYRRGQRFRYHGGLAKNSPVRLSAPHAGHWNLVIDLGGGAGSIRASVRTIKA
jgi:hypothetical protein